MDLTLIQDAFDRVSKKQKVCYTKTQDVIDRTLHELEVAAKQLSETSTDQKLVLTGLQGKLAELAPSNQVQCCHFTHTPSPRSLSNFSSLKFRLSMACLLLLLSLCWCWRFTLATAVCRLAIVRFPFVLLCRNVNGEYLFSALLGQTASC
jgi:hypothetical protein